MRNIEELHHKSGCEQLYEQFRNKLRTRTKAKYWVKYWSQKLSNKIITWSKLIYPFFQFLHYPWWSSGTSPADNFMGLFLPGCCSLTKVCPVEERSVMEISNGSTSDKLPPVTLKFEVSVSWLWSLAHIPWCEGCLWILLYHCIYSALAWDSAGAGCDVKG